MNDPLHLLSLLLLFEKSCVGGGGRGLRNRRRISRLGHSYEWIRPWNVSRVFIEVQKESNVVERASSRHECDNEVD